MERLLVLEDGSVYHGEGFGADKFEIGELVFNTGMSGYQEILTDLSYCAQIVVMTYPMVGNAGVNKEDMESLKPALFGMVVSEYCEEPSNFRSIFNLEEIMKQYQIPGISGVDTRSIAKKLRDHGVMKAVMCNTDCDIEAVIDELKNHELPHDHVARVSAQRSLMIPGYGPRVVLLDFGVKYGIMRELIQRNCEVVVLPYNTSAEEIIALQPDGICLSNGPGDPKDLIEVCDTIRVLMQQVPVLGICLGHQLLCLACDADTIKLKFGHRGNTTPVKNLETGRIEITSQNHGYAVDPESIVNTQLKITHIAVNDGSVEGVAHKTLPVIGIQYHPEATPGPKDSKYLFDQFIGMFRK